MLGFQVSILKEIEGSRCIAGWEGLPNYSASVLVVSGSASVVEHGYGAEIRVVWYGRVKHVLYGMVGLSSGR